jgi:hypothetical protein
MSDFWQQMANSVSGPSKIKEGDHLFALQSLEWFKTERFGHAVVAKLLVVESTSYPVGSQADKAWFVQGESPDKAMAQLKEFIAALLDIADPAKIAEQGQALMSDAQPGRGMQIRCTAEKKTARNKSQYVLVTWSHVPGQTAQSVEQMRAYLNSRSTAPAPAAAPTPAAPPAVAPAAPAAGPGLPASLASLGLK